MTTLKRIALVACVSVSTASGALPRATDDVFAKATEPAPTDKPEEKKEETPLEKPSSDALTDLSLAQLADVNVMKVTSVAGVSKPMQTTPAAMFVITGDDIRRAGHHNVAEALRMVPGINVAQISSNTWSVSSRGFSGQYANKLLVLIDGRAVYTPQFGGVYWDLQNYPIDDIERIEIVRGPGATLWGSNAVNGVINITTKSAKDTQGGLITAGVGNELRGTTSFRYGGKLGEQAHARVYGMYESRDSLSDAQGHSQPDDWEITQGGTRFDWEGKDGTTLTFQGDVYGSSHIGQKIFHVYSLVPSLTAQVKDDQVVSGGNALLRWGRKTSDTSGWSFQTYFDRTVRNHIGFDDERNTYDATFHHYFTAGMHSIIWGLGARHSDDQTDPTHTIQYLPTNRSDNVFSAFVQDTIELVPKRLSLMVGTKLEYNDYTGVEVQPSASLTWTPNDVHTIWASIARAVRTPTRTDSDVNVILAVIPFPVSTPVRIVGDNDLDSEELVAYEIGYRVTPTPRLTLDWATYFNNYRNLISAGPSATGPFDSKFTNNQSGKTYGTEIAAKWEATDKWKLQLGYSWMREILHGGDERGEENEPRNSASVLSSYQATPKVQLNGALYYVDARRAADVPSYLRLDLGVTWQVKPNVEFSLWGQNLLDNRHPEFIDAFALPARPAEVDRGVFAMVRIKF